MHNFIIPLSRLLQEHADADRAVGAKAYMLNQFEMFGIPAKPRRELCKAYIKQNPLNSLKEVETIVKQLWQLNEREYQYCAIELYTYYKKYWQRSSVKLMEYCITHKSWWDTVDSIASEWLGAYFKLFAGETETVTGKWNQSDNIWLQRSSIMFQKAYKKDTDTALLSRYILNLKDSKEFFIQKAIGWALREYAKTNAGWVQKFVKQNKLPALSEREALKRINHGG